MKIIEKLLKKTPAFIWHIKHWYLMTDAWDIDQICKQTVMISVFWALEALFVDEKSIFVNENDKKNDWRRLQLSFDISNIDVWYFFHQQTRTQEL